MTLAAKTTQTMAIEPARDPRLMNVPNEMNKIIGENRRSRFGTLIALLRFRYFIEGLLLFSLDRTLFVEAATNSLKASIKPDERIVIPAATGRSLKSVWPVPIQIGVNPSTAQTIKK